MSDEAAHKRLVDELKMADREISDKNDLIQELIDGIKEIYALRGEDKVIAGICNSLIEKAP